VPCKLNQRKSRQVVRDLPLVLERRSISIGPTLDGFYSLIKTCQAHAGKPRSIILMSWLNLLTITLESSVSKNDSGALRQTFTSKL
jgi:hypothetical protein